MSETLFSKMYGDFKDTVANPEPDVILANVSQKKVYEFVRAYHSYYGVVCSRHMLAVKILRALASKC